jgi:ABC-type uncharacterized transport system substrate-binding protein
MGELKIRVITPVLAKACKDIRTIPILRNAVTSNTTLQEVKSMIANHLCVEASDFIQDCRECNCSLARQIDERALKNRNDVDGETQGDQHDPQGSTNEFIVVHGKSNVHIMEAEAPNVPSIMKQLREVLGDIDSKEITFVGGTLVNTTYVMGSTTALELC